MKLPTLLFTLALLAGGSVAQVPPAPPPAASPVPAPGGPKADGKDAAAQDPDAAPAPGPAAAKGSPQRFEPSERVRPDFDVAFPVDI
jgi:hypothetical protein